MKRKNTTITNTTQKLQQMRQIKAMIDNYYIEHRKLATEI